MMDVTYQSDALKIYHSQTGKGKSQRQVAEVIDMQGHEDKSRLCRAADSSVSQLL